VNESPSEDGIDLASQKSSPRFRFSLKVKIKKGIIKKCVKPRKETHLKDLSELLDIMDMMHI